MSTEITIGAEWDDAVGTWRFAIVNADTGEELAYFKVSAYFFERLLEKVAAKQESWRH